MKVKENLINTVKGNTTIYTIYYYTMSLVLRLIKAIVKPDEKLALFVSYGGRYFNDSPQSLYEAMQKDPRFDGFRMVWAFRNPSQHPEVSDKIKIDSLTYFITALKARLWITNVHIERGLDFKGKNTYYFNTTHTLLPKVTGSLINEKATFKVKGKPKCDCYSVQCELEKEIMEGEKDKVQIVGYPKCDILANYSEEYRKDIREQLGYNDETIILYAPTFREGALKDTPLQVDFNKWENVLGNGYRVLFRAHPVFSRSVHLDSSTRFVKDVSVYPNNNDLIIASDILISDYSGIFFEYGIQEKPMFCYAYDYNDFIKERPLYFDIREELPGGYMKEDELLDYIKNGDREEIMSKIAVFRSKFIQAYGRATETCLDIIYENIQ